MIYLYIVRLNWFFPHQKGTAFCGALDLFICLCCSILIPSAIFKSSVFESNSPAITYCRLIHCHLLSKQLQAWYLPRFSVNNRTPRRYSVNGMCEFSTNNSSLCKEVELIPPLAKSLGILYNKKRIQSTNIHFSCKKC